MLRKRLLIIEEDTRAAAKLIVMLNEHGYEVVCALAAESGLAMLKDFPVDAVVATICEFTGFAALNQLAPYLTRAHIPFILLSDTPSWQGYTEAINRGAFDYLAKPINHAELLAVLARALTRTTAAHPAEASMPVNKRPELPH